MFSVWSRKPEPTLVLGVYFMQPKPHRNYLDRHIITIAVLVLNILLLMRSHQSYAPNSSSVFCETRSKLLFLPIQTKPLFQINSELHFKKSFWVHQVTTIYTV